MITEHYLRNDYSKIVNLIEIVSDQMWTELWHITGCPPPLNVLKTSELSSGWLAFNGSRLMLGYNVTYEPLSTPKFIICLKNLNTN